MAHNVGALGGLTKGRHCTILKTMRRLKRNFSFSPEKNAQLKKERDISFEEIIAAIENDQVLDVIENPKAKYSHQDIAVVLINDYVYLVPFVEQKDKSIFLKTAYPSRKMKKNYLSGGDDDED